MRHQICAFIKHRAYKQRNLGSSFGRKIWSKLSHIVSEKGFGSWPSEDIVRGNNLKQNQNQAIKALHKIPKTYQLKIKLGKTYHILQINQLFYQQDRVYIDLRHSRLYKCEIFSEKLDQYILHKIEIMHTHL